MSFEANAMMNLLDISRLNYRILSDNLENHAVEWNRSHNYRYSNVIESIERVVQAVIGSSARN